MASTFQLTGTFTNLTRLLVPTLKVELPRFTNVRSRTKIKYGQGLTPGEPSTDRYTFGERNRRG